MPTRPTRSLHPPIPDFRAHLRQNVCCWGKGQMWGVCCQPPPHLPTGSQGQREGLTPHVVITGSLNTPQHSWQHSFTEGCSANTSGSCEKVLAAKGVGLPGFPPPPRQCIEASDKRKPPQLDPSFLLERGAEIPLRSTGDPPLLPVQPMSRTWEQVPGCPWEQRGTHGAAPQLEYLPAPPRPQARRKWSAGTC